MPVDLMRNRVEARPGIPLPNGLLSAAAVLPITDVHDENGVDWFGFGCGPADVALSCLPDGDVANLLPYFPDIDPSSDGSPAKTFGRPDWRTAPPVTVYAGIECSVPGWTFDEAVLHARAILNVGEQAALETWLWAQAMIDATDASSAGGDTSVVGRLAALESALAQTYAGVGVVHVPASLASYLASAGLAIKDGGKLRTLTGHLISIGSGYPGTDPDGEAPGSDEAWMLITGPVSIRQGSIADIPGSDRAAIRRSTNDRLVLAERTSVVQIDCGAVATVVRKACCSDVTGS